MTNIRMNAIAVLLTVVSYTQVRCDYYDKICKPTDPAPKEVIEIQDSVKDYVHFLTDEYHESQIRRCCGKYGCFSVDPDTAGSDCSHWKALPSCQDELNITFLLWTKDNKKNYDVIDPEDDETLHSSHMKRNSTVVIYINGYLGTGEMPYIQKIKDTMLRNNPKLMFISVDWTVGARQPHDKSMANAQMVAAVTAYFIQSLQHHYNVAPNSIHIVGVNIGAHIAGAVGKRIPGIGRITGLDPEGWNGHSVCPSVLRMTLADAEFVDVIHTNARTYGTKTPLGHLDIYINGALDQPACGGCPGCNHTIVVLYYLQSFSKRHYYLAYQCDTYENFLRGKCPEGCGRDGSKCASMGDRAYEWKKYATQSPTIMYMSMGKSHSNFHLYHYYVKITFKGPMTQLDHYGRNMAKLKIKLTSKLRKNTDFQEANQESVTYNTQNSITTMITSRIQIGPMNGVVLKWVPDMTRTWSNQTCANHLRLQCYSAQDSDDSNSGCACNETLYVVKYIEAINLETKERLYLDVEKALLVNQELEILQ